MTKSLCHSGEQAGTTHHSTLRRWGRNLVQAARESGSPTPSDLALSVLAALIAARVPGRTPEHARIEGVEHLASFPSFLDPDFSSQLRGAGRLPSTAPLDSCVRTIWAESCGVNLFPVSGDVLGVAYEAILEDEESVSGEAVRRFGGVFYTPPEVVDYIVTRTVVPGSGCGNPITILDPSCGAGAFLVGAARRLLQGGRDASRSRTASVVSRSVFGVDVDARAVRLARTNMTLLAQETACPPSRNPIVADLKRHIITGSALVEPGVDGPTPSMIDTAFRDVLDRGGFDLVMGNPPYVKNRDLDAGRKQLWSRTYGCARGQYDLMVLFLEKGLGVLRPGGRLGFLVSNKFMASTYGTELRQRILETCHIEEITDLSSARVFRGTAIYPTVLILKKCPRGRRPRGKVLLRHDVKDLSRGSRPVSVDQSYFERRPDRILTSAVTGWSLRLLRKIENHSRPLGDLASVGCGLADPRMARMLCGEGEARRRRDGRRVFPFIRVENIRPYEIRWTERWVCLDPDRYSPGRMADFAAKKIVIPGVRPALQAAYDTRGYALGRVYYVAESEVDHRTLLAVLNSRVLDWYYRTVFGAVRMAGGFLRFNGPYLRALPIPEHEPGDPRIAAIRTGVARRLRRPRRHAAAGISSGSRALESDIDETVADLFELSSTERKKIGLNVR